MYNILNNIFIIYYFLLFKNKFTKFLFNNKYNIKNKLI